MYSIKLFKKWIKTTKIEENASCFVDLAKVHTVLISSYLQWIFGGSSEIVEEVQGRMAIARWTEYFLSFASSSRNLTLVGYVFFVCGVNENFSAYSETISDVIKSKPAQCDQSVKVGGTLRKCEELWSNNRRKTHVFDGYSEIAFGKLIVTSLSFYFFLVSLN